MSDDSGARPRAQPFGSRHRTYPTSAHVAVEIKKEHAWTSRCQRGELSIQPPHAPRTAHEARAPRTRPRPGAPATETCEAAIDAADRVRNEVTAESKSATDSTHFLLDRLRSDAEVVARQHRRYILEQLDDEHHVWLMVSTPAIVVDEFTLDGVEWANIHLRADASTGALHVEYGTRGSIVKLERSASRRTGRSPVQSERALPARMYADGVGRWSSSVRVSIRRAANRESISTSAVSKIAGSRCCRHSAIFAPASPVPYSGIRRIPAVGEVAVRSRGQSGRGRCRRQ